MTLRLVGRPERVAEELGERWREASLAGSWAFPADWWTPAVDALAEAVAAGRCTSVAGAELGRARAVAGAGLDETLDDVEALCRCAGWTPADLPRAVAGGWADATCAALATGCCEDPLTGLTSPTYLRTRLRELYREADRAGAPATGTHALVVVEVPVPTGWRELTLGLRVGEVLRATFSGGETLCAATPGRTLVLAGRHDRLPGQVLALRRLLGDRLPDAPVRRLWVERLPGSLGAALDLLGELIRPGPR